MAYIPNPADPTQPTGNVDASTADDEFRALKAYVQGIALAAGTFNGVRQCAQDGAKDANGFPVFLTLPGAGGLALDLDAAPNPLSVNFAGGQNAVGNNDRVGYLTNDVANVIAGLDALNTDYIYADYVTQSNWTWGKTLGPPQYGFAYDRTKQSLMHFEGSNGSVTMLDDYGNTWSASGNAVIDTAQFKIGSSSLKLDGAGDFVESSNFTSLGSGSWTLECYARWAVLPTAATSQYLVTARGANSNAFGLNNTAGTIKAFLNLSSDNATLNIANGTLGAKVAWAINTWYHFALVFDALQGKYFTYIDGVLDQTVVSALKVCAFTKLNLGSDATPAQFLNGWIDEFKFRPYCAYPNGVAFVPSVVAATVEGDYFDIQAMKMYTATGASGAAAANPTLTQKYRVYLGEADTSAAAATAVRNYAYNGKYVSPDTTIPAGGTRTAFAANLGLIPASPPAAYVRNYTADIGYTPGMVSQVCVQGAAAVDTPFQAVVEDKNTLSTCTGSTSPLVSTNRTTGAQVALTTANWKMFVTAQRGW